MFLAAMSSSRNDAVTKSVCPCVRSSVRHEGVFLHPKELNVVSLESKGCFIEV